MAAPARGEGEVVRFAVRFVQTPCVYSQVSPRGQITPHPPKRSTKPATGSSERAASSRAGGGVTLIRWKWTQAEPSGSVEAWGAGPAHEATAHPTAWIVSPWGIVVPVTVPA